LSNIKIYVQEKRFKLILEEIDKQESVDISELSKKCKVSDITIRRDLTELEDKGLLIRTHGGATRTRSISGLFTFDNKIQKNKSVKELICKKAAQFIDENDVVFIDNGTTLYYMHKYLHQVNNLIVITNSLPLVSELIVFNNIRTILIGGEVSSERKAVYGPTAEKNIAEYHATKAFIGTDGISLKSGLTSYDENEANVTKKIAEVSDQVFLLCDVSKIEKDSFIKYAGFEMIDYLVTEDSIDPGLKKQYEKQGIKVV